jgi:hypothetical protein
MAPSDRIKPFPKDHVWIPTGDGKFSHRPVNANDKERRSMVLQLLSPHYDADEKEQVRQDLEQLPWPCHEL